MVHRSRRGELDPEYDLWRRTKFIMLVLAIARSDAAYVVGLRIGTASTDKPHSALKLAEVKLEPLDLLLRRSNGRAAIGDAGVFCEGGY